MTLESRILAWLPTRADRRRVTTVSAIASALEVPVADVSAAVEVMVADGRVVRTSRARRTQHHRGVLV